MVEATPIGETVPVVQAAAPSATAAVSGGRPDPTFGAVERELRTLLKDKEWSQPTGACQRWASQALAVGQQVKAQHEATQYGPAGTRWFAGKVAVVHADGAVDVAYDDGDYEASHAGVLEAFFTPRHAAQPASVVSAYQALCYTPRGSSPAISVYIARHSASRRHGVWSTRAACKPQLKRRVGVAHHGPQVHAPRQGSAAGCDIVRWISRCHAAAGGSAKGCRVEKGRATTH